MNDRNICSTTSADDLLLMVLSKHGFYNLMNICFANAYKRRYEYGGSKSAVFVFIEPRAQ